MQRISLYALGVVLMVGCAIYAQDAPRAFVGAKIIPIEGDESSDGVLVIDGDKGGKVALRIDVPPSEPGA